MASNLSIKQPAWLEYVRMAARLCNPKEEFKLDHRRVKDQDRMHDGLRVVEADVANQGPREHL